MPFCFILVRTSSWNGQSVKEGKAGKSLTLKVLYAALGTPSPCNPMDCLKPFFVMPLGFHIILGWFRIGSVGVGSVGRDERGSRERGC